MKIESILQKDENVVKSFHGGLGGEVRQGKWYITNRRLIFLQDIDVNYTLKDALVGGYLSARLRAGKEAGHFKEYNLHQVESINLVNEKSRELEMVLRPNATGDKIEFVTIKTDKPNDFKNCVDSCVKDTAT